MTAYLRETNLVVLWRRGATWLQHTLQGRGVSILFGIITGVHACRSLETRRTPPNGRPCELNCAGCALDGRAHSGLGLALCMVSGPTYQPAAAVKRPTNALTSTSSWSATSRATRIHDPKRSTYLRHLKPHPPNSLSIRNRQIRRQSRVPNNGRQSIPMLVCKPFAAPRHVLVEMSVYGKSTGAVDVGTYQFRCSEHALRVIVGSTRRPDKESGYSQCSSCVLAVYRSSED
ncbi:hypothetical protein L227DRAFT_239920 [Lentinus tigrinus ALCF2SS1-6]|uniref:Uncharacterized protein n=1 Tax=Lentinus tigrinus ALCF2SS1-6 TaxID=1328759 RepID=A0A5C2S173_9APHY|nr:hypothetical protein L227DRAFT_239920 [Lentinus tigrinus ALCF2SS1-6]